MRESEINLSNDRNQCPSCGLYFNSTAAFDKHRHGRFTPPERRCLTVAEMLQKGMAQNSRNFWITEKNPKFAEINSKPSMIAFGRT